MTKLPIVRFLLVLLALVFCLPLFVHNRLLEPQFDSLRFPPGVGLLPVTYLDLRFLAQLSACFPVLFTALFVWSFFRPASIRWPLAITVVFCLVFLVAYVCYALLLVSGLLADRHT